MCVCVFVYIYIYASKKPTLLHVTAVNIKLWTRIIEKYTVNIFKRQSI